MKANRWRYQVFSDRLCGCYATSCRKFLFEVMVSVQFCDKTRHPKRVDAVLSDLPCLVAWPTTRLLYRTLKVCIEKIYHPVGNPFFVRPKNKKHASMTQSSKFKVVVPRGRQWRSGCQRARYQMSGKETKAAVAVHQRMSEEGASRRLE